MLRSILRLPLPMTNAKFQTPRHKRHKHQRRGRPCQPQELVAPMRLHTNIVPVLVYDARAFDRDGSDQRAGKPNGEEGEYGDHEVEAGGESA